MRFPLTITVSNPSVPHSGGNVDKAVLYEAQAGDDAYQNTLQVIITNTSGSSLTLVDGSKFTFDFHYFLTTEQAGDIDFDIPSISQVTTTQDWGSSSGSGAKYILTYKGSSYTWGAGQYLIVELKQIVTTQPVKKRSPLPISALGITNLHGHWPSPYLTILNAPKVSKSTLDMVISTPDGTSVYILPDGNNSLTFSLSNESMLPIQTTHDTKVSFYFDAGSGEEDLAPAEQIHNFHLNITTHNSDWVPPPEPTPVYDDENPTTIINYKWEFTCDNPNNILLNGYGGISLCWTNMHLPNSLPGLTNMYIQLTGLANFNDATYILPIYKKQISFDNVQLSQSSTNGWTPMSITSNGVNAGSASLEAPNENLTMQSHCYVRCDLSWTPLLEATSLKFVDHTTSPMQPEFLSRTASNHAFHVLVPNFGSAQRLYTLQGFSGKTMIAEYQLTIKVDTFGPPQ
ncbi:MAG: hypothetical protein F6J86_09910 [Symploca sp. SIO1B1]|nr:hypothetical protein [Symploca sp. SIO1B1]